MDKLSNQTKNLMKLTQELLVSADYRNEISNLSYRSVERLMIAWLSCANWIVGVRVEVKDAGHYLTFRPDCRLLRKQFYWITQGLLRIQLD